MNSVTNLLIVHNGENVDDLKEFLTIQFSMLEHIISTDIEFVVSIMRRVPYKFHLVILYDSIKEEMLPKLPYDVEVSYFQDGIEKT